MQSDPRSHGLWEITAPPAPLTGPLQDSVAADVAILGRAIPGFPPRCIWPRPGFRWLCWRRPMWALAGRAAMWGW